MPTRNLPFPLSCWATFQVPSPSRQTPQTQPFGAPRSRVCKHNFAGERPLLHPVDSGESQRRRPEAKIDQPASKLGYDVILHLWSGVTQEVQFSIERRIRRSDLQAQPAVYLA